MSEASIDWPYYAV